MVRQFGSSPSYLLRQRGRSGRLAIRAYMIDFGQLFGGSRWQLADTPTQYLYFDKSAYGFLLLERLCEETLALIDGITDVDLRRISNEIPSSWIAAGDKPELASLLLRAFLRKRDLRALVAQQLDRLRLDTEAQASQIYLRKLNSQ
jgi:hypothetical protein